MVRKELNRNETIEAVSLLLHENKNSDFDTLYRRVIKLINYLPTECQRLFYNIYTYRAFETRSKKLLISSLIISLSPLFIPDYKRYTLKTLKAKSFFCFIKTSRRKFKGNGILNKIP